VVVVENGFNFEVATFRSDGAYLDHRHPVDVRFSSPEEDAKRRDFTINGMFFDPEKNEVIDFVGGRSDLDAKLIRAIGDPTARFAEDRLRMLRAALLAPYPRTRLTIPTGMERPPTPRRSIESSASHV